ncbi:DNA-binding protein [Candidatus Amarobacter glycogenicus]|uniref:DNA-binding protein n=1 Tax=Candidatus Amarobacter glycogenicus TaxID=3140699 RepID=UPI0031350C42|nr:DNA-binding protein [Dehalococcoidia bacterium]
MFESRLPIILTGIGEPATQADLLDRSIGITLEPIFEDRRRTDKDFWDGFGTTHAEVLGALLDLIVGALKHLPSVPTTGLPRMADFARFGIAVERAAGWPAGSFMEAYAANRKSSHAVALSGDPVATAILRFMASRDMWDDTATKLMAALLEITSEAERGKWWPTTPNHFSKRLREAAPVIREYGVEVHQGDREGIDGTRVIRLWRIAGDRR